MYYQANMGLLKIIDQDDHHQGNNCGSKSISIMPEGPVPKSFHGKASVVTLGCAKNKVDSEVILGVLLQSGFEITADTQNADLIVVNTCGFLENAMQESIDTILELSALKEEGRLRKLIVTGCLVERHKSDLETEMPEVDHFILFDNVLKIGEVARGELQGALKEAGRPYFLYDDSLPRYLSTPKHYAYVKIAEGCNRPCTFCIIPKLRGEMRSRDSASVVREAQELGMNGVKEINLIAQDLTSYGKDRTAGANLSQLLRSLDDAQAVEWIRLLYAYPVGVDDELLESIVGLSRVVNYLDIPLQHASEKILKSMRRPLGKLAPPALTQYIKSKFPQIDIRTTFIVGFPGETEEDFKQLESLVAEGHYTNVGVFKYSAERDTPAAMMGEQVPEEIKEERHQRLMLAQQKVAFIRNEKLVGSRILTLLEGPHDDTDLLWKARATFQAPEVDGVVIVNDVAPGLDPQIGQFAAVEITDVAGYDLIGRLIPSLT